MNETEILSWRPRLRDSLVVEQAGSELQFISTSDRRVKRFAASRTVFQLIPLLDGSHTVADLIERVCDGSEEEVVQVCSALVKMRQEMLLSKVSNLREQRGTLSVDQLDLYDRQIRLFQEFCDSGLVEYSLGLEAQERLASSTVLVCGIGGLGSVVASSLAAAGVGNLILCDDDIVERSNLTRQIMYSIDDIGKGKVDALAGRISSFNPHVCVTPERRRIESSWDVADLARASDIVINCADDPSIAEMAEIVTEACWPDTPHIIGGGYSYHAGILGLLVIPRVTACWHCLLAEVGREHGRDRTTTFVAKSRSAGIMGAQSGMIGNMISWEAVRYLIGMQAALSGRWVELDYGPMSFNERMIPRRADCQWCA
ncbi:HesA/MoeB/ThiF family protein [Streptomyces sp. NPDC005525]|uniref:HesA/MoeB/ThiF family protein n=1 Tax=Streptomyces sp. NPDC005525 TaxID=3364720 RepID=UPI0036AE4A53